MKAGRMRPIDDRAVRICKDFLVSVERPSSGGLGSADAAQEHGEETEYDEDGYYQTSLVLSHASVSRILLCLLQSRDSYGESDNIQNVTLDLSRKCEWKRSTEVGGQAAYRPSPQF